MFTGEQKEAGPNSLEDEEVSSSSGGMEEEEVDKLLFLEVQVFKFYHRLCHFFMVNDFLWLLFVYRRRRRQDQTLWNMKRPPQVAEEVDEEEVDKLLL